MTGSEIHYETARLRLEPLRVAHAQPMFALLTDERIYRFIPHDPPASLDAVRARFERLEARRSPDGRERWLNWVIRSRADGACLGRVEITIRPDGSGYLAYELGPAHWGRGYASEACGRMVRAMFEEFGVTRIVAEVDTRNHASIRLLERLGFRRIGLKGDADTFKGATSDEYTYALERTPAPGGRAAAG